MKWLVRLYPRSWRERYEEEFLALLEERPLSLRDGLDLFWGALDARLQAQARVARTTGGKLLLHIHCKRSNRFSLKYFLITYFAATLALLLLWVVRGAHSTELAKFIAIPAWLVPSLIFAIRQDSTLKAKLVGIMGCVGVVIVASLLIYGF